MGPIKIYVVKCVTLKIDAKNMLLYNYVSFAFFFFFFCNFFLSVCLYKIYILKIKEEKC